ncbi:hypothetical protein G9A89_003148, partial [Geosiphon pyriformis]
MQPKSLDIPNLPALKSVTLQRSGSSSSSKALPPVQKDDLFRQDAILNDTEVDNVTPNHLHFNSPKIIEKPGNYEHPEHPPKNGVKNHYLQPNIESSHETEKNHHSHHDHDESNLHLSHTSNHENHHGNNHHNHSPHCNHDQPIHSRKNSAPTQFPSLGYIFSSLPPSQKTMFTWAFIHLILGTTVFLKGQWDDRLALTAFGCIITFDALGVFTTFISTVLLTYKSLQEPSIKYPFGVQRYEILFGFVSTIYLLFVAMYNMKESLEHLILETTQEHYDEDSPPFPLFLVIISIGVTLISAIAYQNHKAFCALLTSNSQFGVTFPNYNFERKSQIPKFMRNSFTLITLSCGGAVIAAGILAEMKFGLARCFNIIARVFSNVLSCEANNSEYGSPEFGNLSKRGRIEHHPSIIAIIAVHVWQNSYNHLVGTLSIRVKADANEQAVLAHVYQRLGPLLDIGNTSPVFRNARISIGELTVQISFLYAYQIFFLNQAYTEHQILIKEAIMGSRGTDKVLEKIQEALDRQNYYEAHQMYRTVCRRLIKQKQYSKAIDLLYTGARSLLEHKQSGSATDLSLYMIDAYSEGELPVTDESRDRLIQLMKLFPYDEPGRKRFFDTAIGWSVKFGESPAGDPELHHCVAKLFWKDKIYQEAESHFLAGTSESSAAYGQMLGEWAAQDQPHKCGAYLARAVLQYLCLRNIHDAKIAFNSFEAAISAKHVGQNIFSGTSSYRQTVN